MILKYIDKVKVLEVLCNELELCKEYQADEMSYLFQAEKEKVKKHRNIVQYINIAGK